MDSGINLTTGKRYVVGDRVCILPSYNDRTSIKAGDIGLIVADDADESHCPFSVAFPQHNKQTYINSIDLIAVGPEARQPWDVLREAEAVLRAKSCSAACLDLGAHNITLNTLASWANYLEATAKQKLPTLVEAAEALAVATDTFKKALAREQAK